MSIVSLTFILNGALPEICFDFRGMHEIHAKI